MGRHCTNQLVRKKDAVKSVAVYINPAIPQCRNDIKKANLRVEGVYAGSDLAGLHPQYGAYHWVAAETLLVNEGDTVGAHAPTRCVLEQLLVLSKVESRHPSGESHAEHRNSTLPQRQEAATLQRGQLAQLGTHHCKQLCTRHSKQLCTHHCKQLCSLFGTWAAVVQETPEQSLQHTT